jgi:homoserine kinase type II
MAVFTPVSETEAARLAERLGLGRMSALTGIKAGIENTNYFLDTERGHWVLTLFERLTADQLPFYLQLMKHLARRGIPVPEPQADEHGALLHRVAGKPAAVVNKLAGGHRLAPDHRHCEQVAAMLARMHLAGRDFALYQPNLRGLAWWIETVPVVLPFLAEAQAQLMRDELAFQCALGPAAATLPRGAIHADLFRDNVMFDGEGRDEQLTGFFDFYFAGIDAWLFDIAVCLNDWCCDLDTGALVEDRAAAFVAAYARVRALEPAELRLLPGMLRAAALRFWLSRLWDLHLPRNARLLEAHDPAHFERVLRARVATPWHPAP